MSSLFGPSATALPRAIAYVPPPGLTISLLLASILVVVSASIVYTSPDTGVGRNLTIMLIVLGALGVATAFFYLFRSYRSTLLATTTTTSSASPLLASAFGGVPGYSATPAVTF